MMLTDFLLARIAEDEAAANAAPAGADTSGQPRLGNYVAHFPPGRMLAECAAKRQVVELCGPIAGYGSTLPAVAMECLLDLATVYSDHTDYREEWRP